MRRILLLALVVLLVPLAAACGGSDEEGDDGAAATTQETTGGGGGAAQTINVDAMDFMFMPADLQADPGEVTFELTNSGQFPHAMEIEGNGVEEESDEIQPGDSTSFTVDLDEGTYEVYCPVDGHKEKGMVASLVVGSGGASAGTSTDDDGGETEMDDDNGGETETGDDNGGSGTDEGGGYGY